MTKPQTDSEHADDSSTSDLLDQLGDYVHPPFEKAGTRRVLVVGIRDLQPRRMEYDCEDE